MIASSEKFLSMPATAQNLYFHLKERTNPDGVVNNPDRVKRMVGCSEEDMEILISNKYITESNGKCLVKGVAKTTIKDTEAEELFEELWKLYPNKKGKSSVTKKTKLALLKCNKEELIRAVNRYADSVKTTDPKYIKHGSTFFNGAIYDYMDENYDTLPKKFDISRADSYSEEDTIL